MGLLAALVAGTTEPACPDGGTPFAWQGFGEELFGKRCASCHPWTYGEVVELRNEILHEVTTFNMPPFVPLEPEEQAPLVEWYACGAPEAPRGTLHRRGDATGEGTLDISDPVAILRYLFDGTVELRCLDAADADSSRVLEVTDAVYLLQFLFLGGIAPPEPFRYCGSLPALGCASYGGCR